VGTCEPFKTPVIAANVGYREGTTIDSQIRNFETGTLRNVSSEYRLMYWIVHRWFNGLGPLRE